jgi:hypothetical protein
MAGYHRRTFLKSTGVALGGLAFGSGAVALVRSLRPDASAEAVESLIRETASSPEEGSTYHGAGHLDLEALVKAASKGGRGSAGGGATGNGN